MKTCDFEGGWGNAGAIIKGAILFSAGRHAEVTWRASCPPRKVSRATWFFHISVLIDVYFTINLQKKKRGSLKSLPCRGLLLSFYEFMKLGVLAK